MFKNYYGKTLSSGGGSTSDFFTAVEPNRTNLFDGVYLNGKLLQTYGSGAIVNGTANKNYCTEHFIPVTEGKYLYIQRPTKWTQNACEIEHPSSMTKDSFRINWYKTAETTTASYISTSDATVTPVQVPTGAKYCLFSVYLSYGNLDDVFVGLADDNSADMLPYERYYSDGEMVSSYIKHENLTFKDKPLYEGKRWVLFGDSLTDSYGGHDWLESTSPNGGIGWRDSESAVPWTGYYWATKIARELGLYLDNRGKSGSNMCISTDSYKDVSGVYMLNAFLEEIDNGAEPPEYITIGFGTNMYGGYAGNESDTSETLTTSYWGACRYFIEKIREKCPSTAFGFIIPPAVDWKDSQYKREGVPIARQIIKSVCEEYGVPYFDMEKKSGITVDMLPDGVHVSSIEANNLYMHAMRGFLMTL